MKTKYVKTNQYLGISSLLVVFILPFIVVVNQLIFEIDSGIQFARKEQLGLQYNYPLRQLLEDVIQHRALVNAYFNSDISFPDNLKVYQSKIEEKVNSIEAVDRRIGQVLKTNSAWRIIKRRWQDIKSQYLVISYQESYDYHNLLIADILALIAHVGDTSNLILDPVLDSYYLMDALINQLPNAIDYTARVRDFGTNVLLQNNLTPENKALVIILSSSLKSTIEKLSRGRDVSFGANPELQSNLEKYYQDCLLKSRLFLDAIRQKLLNKFDIQGRNYFAGGSQAIEAQFKLYDVGSPALNELLQKRINSAANKKYFIFGFTLLVIAISIYVFVAFTRNLNKRRRTEKALKEAEAKYRQIFENAVEGIFQTTLDGRFLSANQALASILGYSSPLELITNITDIKQQLYVYPSRREEFIDLMGKQETISRFEYQIYRKDRSVIWLWENARAARDAEGKLLYYEGTVEDITERKVMEEALRFQQEQTERLLLNILPSPIAERLKKHENTIADSFPEVTVLFADLVGFTEISSQVSPTELVELLNKIFSAFDHLAEQHKLEKIKTIGDAYMVVGGIPIPRLDHADAIAEMALDMQGAIADFNFRTGGAFSIRIGINTGPVIAGVIGIRKFIYDLWGDTVNIASRMESHGLPGCIQVTDVTYDLLQDKYLLEERGIVHIKGKGDMKTYLLKGRKE